MLLQAFDSSYFERKSLFEDDAMQNYLLFQSFYKCFKKVANHILAWKSKGLCDESIEASATSNNSLAPMLTHINTKLQVKLDDHCTFTHK